MTDYRKGFLVGAVLAAWVVVMGFGVVDTYQNAEEARRHDALMPYCAKERSALECEALWQGIEVKP